MDLTKSGIVANLKGEIIGYSKASEKIFGYTKEDVLGKNVAMFHPERSREALLPRLFEEALKGEFKEEVTLVRKNGEEFPALLIVTPLKDKDEIIGLAGMTEDLSKQ